MPACTWIRRCLGPKGRDLSVSDETSHFDQFHQQDYAYSRVGVLADCSGGQVIG